MNRCPSQLRHRGVGFNPSSPSLLLSLSLTLHFPLSLFVLTRSIHVISLHFGRCLSLRPVPLSFIRLCLCLNQKQDRGHIACRTSTLPNPPSSSSPPSPACLLCCVTFTDLHNPLHLLPPPFLHVPDTPTRFQCNPPTWISSAKCRLKFSVKI